MSTNYGLEQTATQCVSYAQLKPPVAVGPRIDMEGLLWD